MRTVLYCATALLLLLSCKGVEDIEFTGIDHFTLTGIEKNTVTFTAGVGVHNPSTVSFRISEVNLKTSIDGSFLGTLSTPEKVKVIARTDSVYTMQFSLELANLMASATTLYGLSRKKQVDVHMQGYVKARSWLTTRKVDVNEEQRIDMPSIGR